MDRMVHIDVDLIANITGFQTIVVKLEDHLDNEARDMNIVE
jgi:hypothetical protein